MNSDPTESINTGSFFEHWYQNTTERRTTLTEVATRLPLRNQIWGFYSLNTNENDRCQTSFCILIVTLCLLRDISISTLPILLSLSASILSWKHQGINHTLIASSIRLSLHFQISHARVRYVIRGACILLVRQRCSNHARPTLHARTHPYYLGWFASALQYIIGKQAGCRRAGSQQCHSFRPWPEIPCLDLSWCYGRTKADDLHTDGRDSGYRNARKSYLHLERWSNLRLRRSIEQYFRSLRHGLHRCEWLPFSGHHSFSIIVGLVLCCQLGCSSSISVPNGWSETLGNRRSLDDLREHTPLDTKFDCLTRRRSSLSDGRFRQQCWYRVSLTRFRSSSRLGWFAQPDICLGNTEPCGHRFSPKDGRSVRGGARAWRNWWWSGAWLLHTHSARWILWLAFR